MRSTTLAVALLAICAGQSAEAAHRGGIAPSAPSAPVLQSVTVPMGLLTRSGRGTVRLSSAPFTTASVHPVTYPGLGLYVGGAPCATWNVGFGSGRSSSDYTLIAADTPEGDGARTPTPSSTGQNAASGNYVFPVSCKAADGTPSNTVNLTYQGVANAVNYGDSTSDRLDFGVTPSGFGNVAGAQILVSVGANLLANGLPAMRFAGAFTNMVTMKPADNARMPALGNISTGGAMSNITIRDFVMSGQIASAVNTYTGTSASSGNTVHDVIFDNITYYGSEAMNGNGHNQALGAYSSGGCTANCILKNSLFEYIENGSALGDFVTLQNVVFRYIYANCMFMSGIHDVLVEDVMCLSPNSRVFGQHTDSLQIADTGGPYNITFRRLATLQGDGDDMAQGPYFGGGPLGKSGDPFTGYIDDGTAGHGPGNVLTRLTGYWGAAAEGSIIATVGAGIAPTDHVTIHCLPSNCDVTGSKTSAQLNGLAATNIGSPSSPATFVGMPVDVHMSGILVSMGSTHGTAQSANGGNSYIYDFAFTQQQPVTPKINSFMGSIIGGVLTATTVATTNIPGTTGYISNSGRLNYPGCNYCSIGSVGNKSSGSDFGPGTWTVSASLPSVSNILLTTSQAYDQGGAWFIQGNCDTGNQQGTFNLDRGWYQGNIFANTTGGCPSGTFPASNTTIGTKAFGYGSNGTITGADFASGMMPKAYLAAVTSVNKDWTPAQILRLNCLAQKGAAGGKFDLGGGDWASAVTGETNATTHTGGGDWIWYDDATGQHVHTKHIVGCEDDPRTATFP